MIFKLRWSINLQIKFELFLGSKNGVGLASLSPMTVLHSWYLPSLSSWHPETINKRINTHLLFEATFKFFISCHGKIFLKWENIWLEKIFELKKYLKWKIMAWWKEVLLSLSWINKFEIELLWSSLGWVIENKCSWYLIRQKHQLGGQKLRNGIKIRTI